MLDLFNIPTPQTANYQEFYGGTKVNGFAGYTWVKPRGASMVRFMLIGPGGKGGNGSSTAGGGGGASGTVTSWIGPAMFVPDILNIFCGQSGSGEATYLQYRSSNGINILLDAANGGNGSIPNGGLSGGVMSPNQFTACGIFTSIAGQAGGAGSSTTSGTGPGTSTTTFLSGGGGGAGSAAGTGGNVVPNYGYQNLPATTAGGTVAGANGYFITQPILVGTGGAGGTTSTSVGTAGGRGGIGCGGGGAGEDATTGGGQGGDGAVFIWAW